MVARDLPQKFRILRIETSVKTFSGNKKEKSVELQQILRSSCRLLRIETSVKTFSCYFWCPCVPRVSSVRTDMFFPLFVKDSNADLQYMVKSYI